MSTVLLLMLSFSLLESDVVLLSLMLLFGILLVRTLLDLTWRPPLSFLIVISLISLRDGFLEVLGTVLEVLLLVAL